MYSCKSAGGAVRFSPKMYRAGEQNVFQEDVSMNSRVLVTGAGGFIGHHLVKYLLTKGYWVRGVDIKEPEYEPSPAHAFELLDLRRYDNCLAATRGIQAIYHLAADMGGIGYITANHADIT